MSTESTRTTFAERWRESVRREEPVWRNAMCHAIRSRWCAALAMLMLTLPIACSSDGGVGVGVGGGGGGGGGDGGGIGGSGVSIGSIDGFGSVFLNGQRLETDAARIVIEGELTDQSSLRVGMLVRAEVDFTAATASEVVYDATLRGPIESIDVAGGRVTILRQQVAFDAGTVFESVAPSTLAVGSVVEISGSRDADDTLVAGFVRSRASDDPLQIEGIVTAVDAATMRFGLGGLDIDYAGADLSSLDSPVREDLSLVVTAPPGAFDAVAGRLAATVLRPGTRAGFDADTSVELEGIVTAFDDPNRFSVNGQAIRTDDTTTYLFAGGGPAAPASVALNTRVEIGGRVAADGALVAERLVVVPPEESRLIGPIERLDPTSRTLVVLGVTAVVTERTRVTGDATDGGGFESLREGMYVRLDAAFVAERLVAARVDVQEADEEARLRGPVTGLDRASAVLEILGVPIVDGEDTDYELADGEEVGRSTFVQRIELGDIVTARWRDYRSTTLPPDDVELEAD